MLSVDLTYDAAVFRCKFCPFQFQCLGQQAVCGCPLIAYDTLAFYLFVWSQLGVGLVYDAVDERDSLGLCCKLVVVQFSESVFLSPVAQVVEVGDDDGRGKFLILSKDKAVLDIRRLLEQVLDYLRGYVFAEREFEDFLLAVSYLKVLAVYKASDISGVEESV